MRSRMAPTGVLSCFYLSLVRTAWKELNGMELRFYQDPETGQPHIYQHGVSEKEVREVLEQPGEDRPGGI
jgi:hypothetical protein